MQDSFKVNIDFLRLIIALFAAENFQDSVRDHLRKGMKETKVLETSVRELKKIQ